MQLTDEMRKDADKIVKCSIDQVPLENMALRICIAELKHKGFYTTTIAGVKTLFILEQA